MKYKTVPLLVIILFALAAWGPQYALRGMWEPDEPRYTYVAWEMAQSGHYFTPVRNGEYYAHKPPLMFWLIQAGTLLTKGEYNGISGRLPTLLGIVLALWAFVRISALWYDRETAWWAMFILSTSFLFWHKAGTGQIDMLLLGLELCALWFLFKNDETPALWNSVAAFLFMGLAILAKGPVGLIVPCGIYFTVRVMSGRKKDVLKKQWLWGIPLALSLPGAWLLLAKAGGAPDAYFRELLFDQNLGRVQGSFGGHYKPVYYYLKYLVTDFMPWTFFMPAAVMVLISGKHNTLSNPYRGQTRISNPDLPVTVNQKDRKTRGLLAWILFVVVFFSLCGGKRNLYILSVYPAASLLLASALPGMADMSKRWKNWSVYPLMVIFGLLGLGGLILGGTSPFLSLPVSLPVFITAGGGLLLLAGAVVLVRCHGWMPLEKEWFGCFIVFLVIVFFYVGTVVFPAFDSIKTPAAVAQKIAAVLPEHQPVLYYRMNGEIISLYAGRKGKRLDEKEALLAEMNGSGGGGVVVFSAGDTDELMDGMVSLGPPRSFTLGGKTLAWLVY